MLALVMVLAMLFAISVFADGETFVIGQDKIASVTVTPKNEGQSGTKWGDPIKLFDGDTRSTNSWGWHEDGWSGWAGNGASGQGSTATIELDKEYLIKSAQLYSWTNNNPGVTIKFLDAKGKATSTTVAYAWQGHTDGTALTLSGSDFKAKTIVISYPGGVKGDGACYKLIEIVLNAQELPPCTHDIGTCMDEYEIIEEATCTSPAKIKYECTNCGDEVELVPVFEDVTDRADQSTIQTDGAGGDTSGPYSMFDNNLDTYLHASGNWYVQSEVTLDMNYYLNSVTVWVGAYGDHSSNGANMTFWYKVPGETEWVEGGKLQTPVELAGTKYVYTLEFATPVLASAVKIRVDGLASFSGQLFEAKVAGALLADAGVKGHSWVAGETVAPTCVANGYTTYACSACGLTKQADFVDETKEHTWVDATCEAPKTCSVCKATEGNALGHNYVAGEQAEDGSITYTCANNCGDTYVINNSAVNGEYFLGTDAVVFLDGVLTTMGNEYSYENNLTTGMITTNNETIYFQVIEGKIYFKGAEVLHQHNEETLIVETTDATCTEDGKTVTTCPFCGILSEETIEAEGHIGSWSEIYEYVSATCMAEGYKKDICEVCNEEYTEIIPVDTVYGHNAISGTEEYLDATCISDGYYKYQCDICNEEVTMVYESDENAHAWDLDLSVYVAPTCKDDGYSYNKCSLCEKEVEEVLPAESWAHKYNNGVASNGVIVYTCTLCGNSYEEELDPALPYGDITAEIVANDPEFPWMVESVYYSVSVPGNYVLTIKDEADVYVVYSDGDELIEASTFAFTLAEGESITFSVMTSDRAAGTVELNLASADNAMLNGTYVTPDGSALFVFADGALTVTDTNEMMPSGFAGEYTYNYNSVTGEVAVDPSTLVLSAGLDMGGNTQIYVFGRMPLNAYVPPMDVVLGDNSFTFVNDNYYFNDQKVVFTATEAGTYVITASETGMVIVESMYGEVELPFEVELAEGESFEFIVATSADVMTETEDTVVVNIAKKVTHVHVEEIIPAILPTPSVTGYTAGVKCSDCGETLVAPKAIEVTELSSSDPFRFRAASVSLGENISINYKPAKLDGYNNVYVVFVLEGEEYIVTEYDYIESFSEGYRYSFKFRETGPELIASNIDAYCYAETETGFVMNKRLGYSIQAYCEGQLKSANAELTTVISNMLVMCAKTQLYMGVNTDNLITDVFADNGYTLTPTAFTTADKGLNVQAITGDRTMGTDWKAGSLVMGASTEINFKFETDNLEGLKIKVNFAGEDKYFDAKELETEVASNGKTRYIVNVNYVKSFQFNEVVTATFERNGEQIGSTVTYSVNSYLVNNYDNTKLGASTRDLIKALYVYGVSAAEYFG